MVGFEKMTMRNLQVNKNHPLTNMGVIALKYTGSLLAGVTVKAEAPLIERRIDKTVINVTKSITSDGATVLEVVRKLPGVQVSAEGQISMYGKSGITVYIDGKPTYLSAGDLASLLNGMSASAVQRIEIMLPWIYWIATAAKSITGILPAQSLIIPSIILLRCS